MNKYKNIDCIYMYMCNAYIKVYIVNAHALMALVICPGFNTYLSWTYDYTCMYNLHDISIYHNIEAYRSKLNGPIYNTY